jgi:hypothetical protein
MTGEPAARMGALHIDDVRMLMELGYIGLSAGMDAHAAAIFEGVQAACPAEEAGCIGRALVDVARGNLDAAIKALRSLPPTDTARAFLAMALIHQGDHVEARAILSDVAASEAGAASELARDLLKALDDAPTPLAAVR